MKRSKIAVKFIPFLLLAAVQAFAAQEQPPGSPPPEAFKACEGKSVGNQTSIVTPRGDIVTGICSNEKGRLVMRPDQQAGYSPSARRNQLPAEAYKACENKAEGAEADLINPQGEKIVGSCIKDGGRLVLRPHRPPK